MTLYKDAADFTVVLGKNSLTNYLLPPLVNQPLELAPNSFVIGLKNGIIMVEQRIADPEQ